MTTLTIGRFSMSDGPSAIRHDGDNLDLDLQIDGATTEDPTEAKVLRQQLLGLANNADEPVVPLTFSDDSDLDGFYVVEGVSCEPFEMFLNNGTFEASVSLRRVSAGYAKPLVEVSWLFGEISNPHSVSELGRVAVPNTGRELDPGSLASPAFITTETGGLVLVGTSSMATTGVVSYQVDPSDYYDGAVTLQVNVGGTWRTVVGRQLPSSWTSWRISNGWVRFGPQEVVSGEWAILVEAYLSGSWYTILTLERGYDFTGWVRHDFAITNPLGLSVPGADALAAPIIMRNSPERVTLRVPQYRGGETWSLSRGDAYLRGTYSVTTLTDNLGVGSRTAVAVTDSTSNMVRTSADSNGFKFFVSTPVANTVDTTNARIYSDAATSSFSFAAGYSTPNTYASNNEVLFSLCAHGITQRISTR